MKEKLTTAFGAPVADNNNSLTAGPKGPMLMQDVWYLEKMAHFDREVIPERRMHAKGSGAFGTFTVTHDITKYTKAKIFSEIGKKTEMFARFSTVAGERGAADAERDIRGFALKFYTEEGNWDLAGNNTPVFFLRDPLKFPDLNHAVKRDPKTNMRSATNNWDFWTNLPEALHQVTITMSDRGIPFSYRHMHGFGSHTFSFINAENKRNWVKFHFVTQQGIKNLTDAEAQELVGQCRESHQKDLFDSIEKGDFPKWKMFIQIMSEEDAKHYRFNPFDLTRVWLKKDYPLIEVGEFELNRNPENYFADVEQAAFNPASVVPGISFSPDKMLQARIFSYPDAHRYRVGTHYEMLPVNRPIVDVNTYHADGSMNYEIKEPTDAYYEPNSFGGAVEDASFAEPAFETGDMADRYNHRDGNNDFVQVTALFNLMSDNQKEQLFSNIAEAMGGVPRNIVDRQLALFEQVHKDYAAGVKKALGI